MRENKKQKIEVHVAGNCFKDDKVLILKRSSKRKIYPGLWECGGGQVLPGENFQDAIARQMKEEAGIKIKPEKAFELYEIKIKDSEQKTIPGVRFICRIISKSDPAISEEHTQWKFISLKEVGKYKFIPGIAKEIKEAYEILKAENIKIT